MMGNDLDQPPRTAFLIGTEGALADRLRDTGIHVLGEVADLDLFFPLSRQCGAGILVLAEAGAGRRPMAEAIAQLRIVSPGAEIFVLTAGSDVDLYDAGAGMVFSPPHHPEAIVAALAKGVTPAPAGGGWRAYIPPGGAGEAAPPDGGMAFRRESAWRQREVGHALIPPPAPPGTPAPGNGRLLRQQVVAVLGARGGVGQTFLAAHTAAAVALASRTRTLLVDLSPAGDAGMHLDLPDGPTLIDLLPHLGASGGEGLDRHVRVHRATGLHVLAGIPRPELDELVAPEHVESLLTWVRREYDFVFLDAPNRLSDERLLCCARLATRILLVTTAEVTAIRQGRFLLEWLAQHQVPVADRIHLVINRANPEGSLSPGEVRRLIGLDPAATVPEDRRAAERTMFGGQPVAARPDHPLARAVWRIAGLFYPLQIEGTGMAEPPQAWLRRLWAPLAGRVKRL